MKFWVLGSGTLLPDPHRRPSAHCLQTEDGSLVLLDCGEGALRSMARLGLPWSHLSMVVFSHLHTDHVGGLAPLLFAMRHGLETKRAERLLLLGPGGLAHHVRALSEAHGPYVLDPGFPLVVQELTPGETWEDHRVDLGVATYGTNHSPGSLALRVGSGKGLVGYTGDTGPDPELGVFLRGCQLLVAECSHRDQDRTDHHLSPESLAEIASVARPELLLTVHAYPPLDPMEVPELVAKRGYSGTVEAAVDGMMVEWSGVGLELFAPGVDLPLSGG